MKKILTIATRLIVPAFAILLFSACGPKISNQNLDKITVNMTEKDVVDLIGKPAKRTVQPFGSTEAVTYSYPSTVSDEVVLVFMSGKLVSKSGQVAP